MQKKWKAFFFSLLQGLLWLNNQVISYNYIFKYLWMLFQQSWKKKIIIKGENISSVVALEIHSNAVNFLCNIVTSCSSHLLITQVWCISQWGLLREIIKAFDCVSLLCFVLGKKIQNHLSVVRSNAWTSSVNEKPMNQIAGFEIDS